MDEAPTAKAIFQPIRRQSIHLESSAYLVIFSSENVLQIHEEIKEKLNVVYNSWIDKWQRWCSNRLINRCLIPEKLKAHEKIPTLKYRNVNKSWYERLTLSLIRHLAWTKTTLTTRFSMPSSKPYSFDMQNRKKKRPRSPLSFGMNTTTSNHKRRKLKKLTSPRVSPTKSYIESLRRLSASFSNLILESQPIFPLDSTHNRKRRLSKSLLSPRLNSRASKIKRSRYTHASISKTIELKSRSSITFVNSFHDRTMRDSQISTSSRFDFNTSKLKRSRHLHVDIFERLLTKTFIVKSYRVEIDNTKSSSLVHRDTLSSQAQHPLSRRHNDLVAMFEETKSQMIAFDYALSDDDDNTD